MSNSNQNTRIKNLLSEDNVVGIYKDLKQHYTANQRHVFYQQLQVYITKVGQALATVLYPNVTVNTYLQSINLICDKVIKDKEMKRLLDALQINEKGNTVKHRNKNIEKSNLDNAINLYNELIKKIITSTSLNAFSVCYITKKNKKEDNLFYEESFHKYIKLDDIDMEVKLSPKYELDKYAKQVKSKLTVYWPTGKDNRRISIQVFHKKQHCELGSLEEIDIEKPNGKVSIPLTISESLLNNRNLEIRVKITLYYGRTNSYTTGVLFWKEDHYYTSYDEDTSTEIDLWVNYFNDNERK